MFKRGQPRLNDATVATLRGWLGDLRYELIPLKNAIEQAPLLPDGAQVSVTASPAKGMSATIELACELQQQGFRAIPHLAARLTTHRAELEGYLKTMDTAGITRAFVVSGDVDAPGAFSDGLALLIAMEQLGHGLTEIGIPGYPEGHPFISDELLRQALHDKQPYASFLTTQMCFTPATIATWVDLQRTDGIDLPVYVGIPGRVEMRRLLAISARIGVGDSMRFLAKNLSLVRRLLRPGRYSPDALIIGLAAIVANDATSVRGIQFYTFNQVEHTERWRQDFLEALPN